MCSVYNAIKYAYFSSIDPSMLYPRVYDAHEKPYLYHSFFFYLMDHISLSFDLNFGFILTNDGGTGG